MRARAADRLPEKWVIIPHGAVREGLIGNHDMT
jgi:hypothetical protein